MTMATLTDIVNFKKKLQLLIVFYVICLNNIKIVESRISINFTCDIEFATVFASWALPPLAASSVTCRSTHPHPPPRPLLQLRPWE
jgi:hypothetical protein